MTSVDIDDELWIKTVDNATEHRLATARLPDGERCAVVDLHGGPIRYVVCMNLKPGRLRQLGKVFAAKISVDGVSGSHLRCTSRRKEFSTIKGRYLGFAPLKTSEGGSATDGALANVGRIVVKLYRCTFDKVPRATRPLGPAFVGDTEEAPEGKKLFQTTTVTMGVIQRRSTSWRICNPVRVLKLKLHYANRLALELQGVLPRQVPYASLENHAPLHASQPAPRRASQMSAPVSAASDTKPSGSAREKHAAAGSRHGASGPVCIDLTKEPDEPAGCAERSGKRPKLEILD
eukprot:jgi/Mesvir1/14725/Mv05373-RA.1